MVIDNTNHTKRCNSKCESFNGYSYCPHRKPIEESHHDYLYRMHRMRSDRCHVRITYKYNSTMKYELIQEKGFSINYGKCSKDEITLLEKRVKVRKRMSAGGVL